MKQVAQQLIDLNIVPIPLSKSGNGKGCFINKWETKPFEAKDFNSDNNIGINLGLSKKTDVDMDSKEAVAAIQLLLRRLLNLNYFKNKNVKEVGLMKGDLKKIKTF